MRKYEEENKENNERKKEKKIKNTENVVGFRGLHPISLLLSFLYFTINWSIGIYSRLNPRQT